MADENPQTPGDEINDDELAALFNQAENTEATNVSGDASGSDEITEDELAALQMEPNPIPPPVTPPPTAAASKPTAAKVATATQTKPATPAFAPVAPFPDVAPTENGMGLLMDIPLRVSIELGRISMTLQQVLALGRGSIIELERLAGEPVDILVNDKLIGYGEVVVVDEYFGVKITELIDPKG